jgi:hypothetical protein
MVKLWMVFCQLINGPYAPAYMDTRTDHVQFEDPQVTKPLALGWELQRHPTEEYTRWFYPKDSGKTSWQDPRLSADALRARGVNIQKFKVV